MSATLPPGRHPPCPVHAEIDPPAQCMLGYGQQAGGMHPTGMHSCYVSVTALIVPFFDSSYSRSFWHKLLLLSNYFFNYWSRLVKDRSVGLLKVCSHTDSETDTKTNR